MQEQQLRGILYQLQEQNKELLQMVMDLQVSNHKLQAQLNQDFYKVYTEMYEKHYDEVEAKELLKSKKFMMDELDHINGQNTEKAIAKFNENLMAMEENLENIIN
jgi:RNA polymerase-interacting CarD/CdnL/TRCF family regulator